MSKPKAWDLVAHYSEHGRTVHKVLSVRPDGKLDLKSNLGSSYDSFIAHPKQCRRLIKKPKRRVWIQQNAINVLERTSGIHATSLGGSFLGDILTVPFEGAIEFIEVRKEK